MYKLLRQRGLLRAIANQSRFKNCMKLDYQTQKLETRNPETRSKGSLGFLCITDVWPPPFGYLRLLIASVLMLPKSDQQDLHAAHHIDIKNSLLINAMDMLHNIFILAPLRFTI